MEPPNSPAKPARPPPPAPGAPANTSASNAANALAFSALSQALSASSPALFVEASQPTSTLVSAPPARPSAPAPEAPAAVSPRSPPPSSPPPPTPSTLSTSASASSAESAEGAVSPSPVLRGSSVRMPASTASASSVSPFSPRGSGVLSPRSPSNESSGRVGSARPLPSVARGVSKEAAVIASHPEWLVEEGSDVAQNPELTELRDIYSETFGRAVPHVNFLLVKEGEGARGVVCVAKTPQQQFPAVASVFNLGPGYRALHLHEGGADEFFLHNVPLQRGGEEQALTEDLGRFLNERLQQQRDSTGRSLLTLYPVENKELVTELAALEQKHSRKLRAFKVAVLYVTPGQTDMAQIFANKPPEGSGFWAFMDRIARKVNMDGWDKYRGDMGKTGEDARTGAYYEQWSGIEILFHMAPWMSAEQHRRLCGNDIGVLIYYDAQGSSQPFVPFDSIAMGTVPHVFAVVQPHPSADGFYRLGFMQRPAVGMYKPQTPPPSHYFTSATVREFLYTKLHNGFVRAQACPPMDRLFKVPRRAAIKELSDRYPPETARDKQRREKAEQRLRDIARESSNVRKILTVRIGSGRNLASKDANGLSDPYLELSLVDHLYKTRVIKKSLSPHWNEHFEFDLTGVNPDLDELKLVCWDWNAGLFASASYMGECRMLVKDIPYDEEKWFSLVSTTTEIVSGEIQLTFIRGESAGDVLRGKSSKSSLKPSSTRKELIYNYCSLEFQGRVDDKEKQKVIQDSLSQVFGL